jgi:hypothetical protein
MKKNEAWVKIGSALCVAMLSYIILNLLVKDMLFLWKISITFIIAIIAFAVAFWAGKKEIQPKDKSSGIAVGTRIASKGSVNLEDVTLNTKSGEDIVVCSDISADKNVRIQNVNVDSKG